MHLKIIQMKSLKKSDKKCKGMSRDLMPNNAQFTTKQSKTNNK